MTKHLTVFLGLAVLTTTVYAQQPSPTQERLVLALNQLATPQIQGDGSKAVTLGNPVPAPVPVPVPVDRPLSDKEIALVYEEITWLFENGKINEAIELERLLNEGKIKADPNLPSDVAAEWRNGVLYLNPKITSLTPWDKKGNPKTNAIIAQRQFEERIWLVSILLHEWVHYHNGEQNGGTIFNPPNEKRAYQTQKDHLIYVLNNKAGLTETQKQLIRDRIEAIDEIVKENYGGW